MIELRKREIDEIELKLGKLDQVIESMNRQIDQERESYEGIKLEFGKILQELCQADTDNKKLKNFNEMQSLEM